MGVAAASDGDRRQAAVEQLDPVPHGTLRATGNMHQTADIRGRNDIRLARLKASKLIQLELLREIGMQNRVGTLSRRLVESVPASQRSDHSSTVTGPGSAAAAAAVLADRI